MDIAGNHILIVDDNLENLRITAKILKDEGFLISLAQDGRFALTQLEQQIPDLILLDIMMPGMDGFEVCRKIKESDNLKETPVIFLTAKNQSEDLVEGFKAGGVDYITKPFKREELLIRVKNHLELAGSRKKILEMNKTRDKLYSIIAHDIRQPFSGISLTISAISEGLLDPCSEDFKDIIHDLRKTTLETSSLLDNLLEWTKLQSSTLLLSPECVNLNALIVECVQLLDGSAKDKEIAVKLVVPADIHVFFDVITMRIVIRNLLSNAIKFTPVKGTIEIKSLIHNKTVKISVRDTGIGMTEEIIEKIFIQGDHLTSPGTNNEPGSGLGLYMVKDFISKNNGTINVESQVGKGSIFTIAFAVDP